MRRGKLLAALIALVVVVCVGSEGVGWSASAPQTKEEWIAQGDAVCTKTQGRVEKLTVPAVLMGGERVEFAELTKKQLREVRNYFSRWRKALVTENDALGDLSLAFLKAQGDALSEGELIAVGRTEVHRLRRLTALHNLDRALVALRPGTSDSGEIYEALGDLSILHVRAAQMARHAGLKVCSEALASCCLMADAAASLDSAWVVRCLDSTESGNPVDCSEPHGAEIYAVGLHPAAEGEAYPTGGPETLPEDMFSAFVDEACGAAFTSFVGVDVNASSFDYRFLLPSKQDWDGGDRIFGCFLVARNGEPLTTGARGTSA